MQKVHTITTQGFFISTKRGGFPRKKKVFFILWSVNFCRCYRTYIYIDENCLPRNKHSKDEANGIRNDLILFINEETFLLLFFDVSYFSIHPPFLFFHRPVCAPSWIILLFWWLLCNKYKKQINHNNKVKIIISLHHIIIVVEYKLNVLVRVWEKHFLLNDKTIRLYPIAIKSELNLKLKF